MAFRWRIDHEHSVVVCQMDGRVDRASVDEYFDATYRTDALGYDEFSIGLTVDAIDVERPVLRAFLSERSPHVSGRKSRIAIIAPAPAAFGVARMISLLSEGMENTEAQAFRSVAEALVWLELPADYDVDVPEADSE